MEQGFAILATVLGFGAFFGALVSSALKLRFFQSQRKRRHTLEVTVKGSTISIDVSRIDAEDPNKLNRAIQAVRDARRLPSAA